jgi:hypothetical protein
MRKPCGVLRKLGFWQKRDFMKTLVVSEAKKTTEVWQKNHAIYVKTCGI